jgi:hypothetical protein
MESHTFKFKVSGKPVKFTIFHDLKDFGLDIVAGFENWLVRTDKFTGADFVSYLKGKTPTATIKKF